MPFSLLNFIFTAFRKRLNFLRMVNVRKAAELTPKAKFFYRFAKSMLASARRIEQQNASNRTLLEEAIKIPILEEARTGKVNSQTA